MKKKRKGIARIFFLLSCLILVCTPIYAVKAATAAFDPSTGITRFNSHPASNQLAITDTPTPTPTFTNTPTETATPTITPTATFTSTVTPTQTPKPDINVQKSVVNVVSINPDVFIVAYRITVKNTGAVVLKNIQVQDDLKTAFAAAKSFKLQQVTSNKFTLNTAYNGDTNINMLAGTDVLNIGASGSITLVVVVNTGGRAKNYTNSAKGIGDPPSGPPVDDTGEVSGPSFVDPSLAKTADVRHAKRGDLVTFTITVSNRGNEPAKNVHVIDPLPNILDILSAQSSRGTVTTTGRTVEVNIGDVSPNELIIITIVTRINMTGEPPIRNQARLTTDSSTDITSNDSDHVAVVLDPVALPDAGFAPNRFTQLPAQPKELAYFAPTLDNDFTIQVPRLGITMPIVGVPESDNSWDISWLGSQAGWLNGTAFPTHSGNSVITGHVYLSNGSPGPFVNLGSLRYGDQVVVNLSGYHYIYEVQNVAIVSPNDVSPLRHESLSWLTLITCKQYDEKTNAYNYRTVVRAVLVQVLYGQ